MKYKDINIYSHQRSGSHYFAALISQNFFGESDYRDRYKNHPIGKRIQSRIDNNKDILFAYIFRSFDNTAKSVFKMRDRFGLAVDDYNSFLTTKYCDMWTSDIDFRIKIDYMGDVKYDTKVSGYFRKVNHTPREFWLRHRRFWKNMQKTRGNVIVVKYDNIIWDLDTEMDRIATKLDFPKQQWVNIEKKIGWTPESKGETK
jgi:hypothetical protein